MSPDLENILKNAAVTVFTTMLKTSPEFGALEPIAPNGEQQVTGAVNVTGALNGTIYFCSSAAMARRLTCRMLSMSDSEIEDDAMVNDVIGELTNMLAGQVKLKVHQSHGSCLLTVPSVVRGSAFKACITGPCVRKSISFKCDGGNASLEAALKP